MNFVFFKPAGVDALDDSEIFSEIISRSFYPLSARNKMPCAFVPFAGVTLISVSAIKQVAAHLMHALSHFEKTVCTTLKQAVRQW